MTRDNGCKFTGRVEDVGQILGPGYAERVRRLLFDSRPHGFVVDVNRAERAETRQVRRRENELRI